MFPKLEYASEAQGKTKCLAQHNLHSKPTILCNEFPFLKFISERSFFMLYVAVGIAIDVR